MEIDIDKANRFLLANIFTPDAIKKATEDMKPKIKCHYHVWSTYVYEDLVSNEIYVDTPISREYGFKTPKDAINYAESYGRVDARKN